jgi:murein DD-endopeptidase MepM/ murein hydrolase activator NlpD
MKRVMTLLACLAGAVFIVVVLPILTEGRETAFYSGEEEETALVAQQITGVHEKTHQIYKVYNGDQLIGVLSSRAVLKPFLAQVYAEDYEADYPASEAALGQDVYVEEEASYFVYENVDDEILAYLRENHLFSLAATAVEFSDDSGVYAEIYVSDIQLYEEAMREFLTLFVSQEDLARLSEGQTTPQLDTYGSQVTAVSISQTITTKETYADPASILTDKNSILDYLEYGDNTEREYYTVEKYDTVAGVGSKNNGLSATQVMNINRDKISSVDQVLEEGETLCVTYFTSPIDVVVTEQSMRQETIFPETIYQEDSSLREGYSYVEQEGINGSKNTLYSERWINGVLISGTEISSVDTLQPVNEIVRVGTLVIPGVGTGTFRWPVDNAHISCGWGCYYGHEAVDVQNYYDRWGPIYAADRGVIETIDYDGISGNYVIINHNNGYYSYYGHMITPSPLSEGDVVDKGDQIGMIGMTGRATGPHVHFFIFTRNDDGTRNKISPCEFLDCSATI